MIVKSKILGNLDVEEVLIYTFEHGIPGFEHLKRYVIVQPDPELPFSYLQSIDDDEVTLLLTNPFLFYGNYDFELNEQIQEELQIEDPSDIAVWSVVSTGSPSEGATLNLLAPIIISAKKMLGRQVILHNTSYRTKHPLIQEKNGGDEHAGAFAQEG